MQHLTLEQIMEAVKDAFDSEVFTTVGDHFGSPSAHLEGKEAFLQMLREKLRTREFIACDKTKSKDDTSRFNMSMKLRVSKDSSGVDRFDMVEIQSLIDQGQMTIQPGGVANYLMLRKSDGKVIAEIEEFTMPKR